jgi:tetratricopeptide (TPR) repeat protein
VWVSDKDRPGTTNLSLVLDEIARTLDYPGFTQFAQDEKLYEVGQLLKRQRVLLVVDNFETITDGALLAWLLRLPEPSKALITSREKHRGLWSSWLAELRGMGETEAQIFIGQRLRALQLDKLVKNPAEFEPLVAVTGGNPKAIEIALGLVKHERRPLQQVVDDLYAARGELFDDLFTRAWALLDEAARRVLLVMTFFPASASGEALAATADVQGFAFNRAVERLIDLALLDVQQADFQKAPRYALHPLVRAFARARLSDQGDLENQAREQWIRWCIDFGSKVGYCWDDFSKLDILDPELETFSALINWLFENQRWADIIETAKGISYYYYVRGLWNRKINVDRMCIVSARNLNRISTEVLFLSHIVHILSRQGRVDEAQEYLQRLSAIVDASQFSDQILYEYYYAVALYWTAKNDFNTAQIAFEKSLVMAEHLPTIMVNNGYHRLATCLYRKGMMHDAQRIYVQSLQEAREIKNLRAVAYHQYRLAAIDLDQENMVSAAERLSDSIITAKRYQDRPLIAQIQRSYARLHTQRGDLPAARAALAEAIDLFERLGMRRELAEARAALTDLDARELVTAE